MTIPAAASLLGLLLCGVLLAAPEAMGQTTNGQAAATPTPAPRTSRRRWCGRTARPTRRSRRRNPRPPRRRPPPPAPAPAGAAEAGRDRHRQRLEHRPAAAALRRAALRRGEPARRPGHALSHRLGLQAPRTAGADPARVRGLAAGAGSRRHQGLGAPGDADRPAQLHRHRRRRDAAAGRAGQRLGGGGAEAGRDRAHPVLRRPPPTGARSRRATIAAISSAASSGARCRARWSPLNRIHCFVHPVCHTPATKTDQGAGVHDHPSIPRLAARYAGRDHPCRPGAAIARLA